MGLFQMKTQIRFLQDCKKMINADIRLSHDTRKVFLFVTQQDFCVMPYVNTDLCIPCFTFTFILQFYNWIFKWLLFNRFFLLIY